MKPFPGVFVLTASLCLLRGLPDFCQEPFHPWGLVQQTVFSADQAMQKTASTVAEADASSPSAEAVDISWDIDITEAAEQTQDPNSLGGSGQGSGPPELMNGKSAQQGTWPESVVRLTKDTSCRTALLDDLHELHAFLVQQTQELASGKDLTC